MTISTVSMNTLMNTLSVDLLGHIGSFLLGSELRRLSLIFRNVWEQRENIMTPLARNEQRRMGMQIVPFRIRLTFDDVIAHWQQLVPTVARAIRNALNNEPLVFYSGLFDRATVLIEDNTLAARGNSQSMEFLAVDEKNIGRAVVLANSISDKRFRSFTLRALALREGVPLRNALEIAHSIPNEYLRIRSFVLRVLALRDGLPLENALEIAHSIPNEHSRIRSFALRLLALRDGVPIENALEIARSLPTEEFSDSALYSLALRDDLLLENALEIARRIPNEYVRSSALRSLALRNGVPFENALEIARSIPHGDLRSSTLSILGAPNSKIGQNNPEK